MSIPLSSIMAMFSFTKVDNWTNVNFLSKCIRLHQIASHISKFSRWWYPRTPIPGEGTTPQTFPSLSASRLPRQFQTPPWNKRLDKALKYRLEIFKMPGIPARNFTNVLFQEIPENCRTPLHQMGGGPPTHLNSDDVRKFFWSFQL